MDSGGLLQGFADQNAQWLVHLVGQYVYQSESCGGLEWACMMLIVKVCMNTCFGKGYTYGGVQYGQ